MNNLSNLYIDLKKHSNFNDHENIDIFLLTVDKIVQFKKPSSIDVLINYFDDESEFSWILTSLRKYLECYPAEQYVIHILNNMNFLVSHALMYADEIINSILNSVEHRKVLMENISLCDKKVLFKLFNYMLIESPHHQKHINKLLSMLKSEKEIEALESNTTKD